jgi:hypothetical protein
MAGTPLALPANRGDWPCVWLDATCMEDSKPGRIAPVTGTDQYPCNGT